METLSTTSSPRSRLSTEALPVCDPADYGPEGTNCPEGLTLSESEARARRVAAEAARWLAFAGERTRMRPETLLAKAFQSACFSVASSVETPSARAGVSCFAVPSKLVRVKEHQRRLWALVRGGHDRFERLELVTGSGEGGRLTCRVTRRGDVLGEVQPKHVPWVRPLVAFGLTVHLSRVTGHEREGHTLGVNVVFGGVGRALEALAEALGCAISGDGAPGAPGDGAPRNLRLVAPGPNTSESLAAEDVVLWRDDRGTARASLGTAGGAPLHHVARHSPTGIEWGYGGSGPSDLALSVLTAVAGAGAAERHYRAFVAEVLSRVPPPGGLLRAARVRAWLRRQEAVSEQTSRNTAGRAAA